MCLITFHYHWGERAGFGSEHLINGKQYDLEIHFVFKKVNNTNPITGDAISILGIFREIDTSAEVSGIWKQVTPTKVLPYNSVGEIDDVIYFDLLPGSRDYTSTMNIGVGIGGAMAPPTI